MLQTIRLASCLIARDSISVTEGLRLKIISGGQIIRSIANRSPPLCYILQKELRCLQAQRRRHLITCLGTVHSN